MTTTAITLKPPPQAFPVGTSVKAYRRSNWPQSKLPPSGAPVGAIAATVTVATDGTIPFTGLIAGATYYAVSDLDPGGSHDYRYMAFTVGDSGDLDPGLPVSTATLTAGLALKEDVANKSTSASLGSSDTLYPSQKAVKGYVDTASGLLVPTSALDTDGTLAANSDAKVATQKATKTYADARKAELAAAYKTLMMGASPLTAAAAAATVYFFGSQSVNLSSLAVGNAAANGVAIRGLTAADYAVAGLTTKLNVEVTVATNSSLPAVTITAGLYPITVSTNNYTFGTVLAGSTVAVATPGASIFTTPANSGDFTFPANGAYGLGVIVSGTPGGSFVVHASLRVRNV